MKYLVKLKSKLEWKAIINLNFFLKSVLDLDWRLKKLKRIYLFWRRKNFHQHFNEISTQQKSN